jgi:hypothetical protein
MIQCMYIFERIFAHLNVPYSKTPGMGVDPGFLREKTRKVIYLYLDEYMA